MRNLARLSLLLVIVLVFASAYLRLHESGIGCPDWPECYGRIGAPPVTATQSPERVPSPPATTRPAGPWAWASPLHLGVAGLLGLMTLALNYLAWRTGRHRLLALLLLVLTVLLGWLGLHPDHLHHPAVVMGHLAAGFLMLALLGWLVFRLDRGAPRYTESRIRHIRPLALAAVIVLCLQILSGGLTSVNFAATACPGLPDCQGNWLPDATVLGALRIWEPHEISEAGTAVGSYERAAIHQLHRISALLTLVFVFAAGISAVLSIDVIRRAGVFILAVALAEFIVGIAAVTAQLPIGLAVAHNGLAGLLLLGLLKLLAVSQVRPVFYS
jgi:cytochrome c oxidase assembly protein subunit 15